MLTRRSPNMDQSATGGIKIPYMDIAWTTTSPPHNTLAPHMDVTIHVHKRVKQKTILLFMHIGSPHVAVRAVLTHKQVVRML